MLTITLKPTIPEEWRDDASNGNNEEDDDDEESSDESDSGWQVLRRNKQDGRTNIFTEAVKEGRSVRAQGEAAWKKEKKRWLSHKSGGNGRNNQVVESHCAPTFNAVRFANVLSGYANTVAVDFLSTKNEGNGIFCPPVENPIIAFREAWILQAGNTLIIRRVIFDPNRNMPTNRLWCNPTGKGFRNVERYWGYSEDDDRLIAQAKRINVKVQGVTESRNVADKRRLFQNRVNMFTQWIKDRRNWYVDRKTGHMYVFTFNPDMVTIKKDRKTYLVQQMACYNVALFQQNDEIQKAYNAFLSDRNEAREAWETVEMKYPIERKLINQMKKDEEDETYSTNGFSSTTCNEVDVYYDNLVKLASNMKSRTYHDYYKRVFEYASETDPNCGQLQLLFSDFLMRYYTDSQRYNLLGLYNKTYDWGDQADHIRAFQKFEEGWQTKYIDELNETVEFNRRIDRTIPCRNTPSLLQRVGERKLQTRRLFWRLFNDKFGVTYETFLTDRTTAEDILKKVPYLFGPSGCDLNICFEKYLSRKDGQAEEDFYLDCAAVRHGPDTDTEEEEKTESEEESEPEFPSKEEDER